MTLRTRFQLTALAIASTLAWITPAHAAPLSDSYLALPVLLDNDASGVYLQHRDSVYFVTARHVLFDPASAEPKRPTVTLRSFTKDRSISEPIVIELDLATLVRAHRILSSKTGDLAAVRIGDVTSRADQTVEWESAPGVVAQAQPGPLQILLDADEWRRFDETEIGSDVFLASTQQLEDGRPLLLEGTLAGKERTTRRLMVDVRVSPRNLGGPAFGVAEVGLRTRQPSFIGIVIERQRQKPSFDDSEHAVVASVDAILDLIDKP